jgi:hypothetical protein
MNLERRITTSCNSCLDSTYFSCAIQDHIFNALGIKKNVIEDKIYLQLLAHFNQQGMKPEMGPSVSEYCLLLSEIFSLKYNAIKYQSTQTDAQHKKQIKQLIFISQQLKK